MLRNYFSVAIRNLWKNKAFSAINVLGLAIGLATSLLIILYVLDELSYDRFHAAAERTYRVDADIKFGGTHYVIASAPAPLGPTLKNDLPEIEEETRFRKYDGWLVRKGSQNIWEEKVIFADSTLFRVFSLPLLAGDQATALREPHTLVITEKTALKYFNTTDAVGRDLLINDSVPYKVTGVLKPFPGLTQVDFDFFASLSGAPESRNDLWLSNNFNTYVVLRKGVDPKKLEAKLGPATNKYIAPQLLTMVNASREELERNGSYIRYTLMPLTAVHLHSNKSFELSPNGSIQYVYIFSAIALFILLIACVNFMNLSTARSANRAREVGIRKVMGSQRTQLVAQFLTESLLVSAIAMLLALGIASLMLPLFNDVAGKHITLGLFSRPWLGLILVGLVLLVGLLAGSYPAFFLSAFRPLLVLKGTIASGFRNSMLRNGLVVFQFSISIILMVGTMVIYNQLRFIRNKQLGFNRDQVMVLQNTAALGTQAKAFRQEVLGLNGVQAGTMTSYLPTGLSRNDGPMFLTPVPDPKNAVTMQMWSVDDQYIPAMGMHMKTGRNFSAAFATDSQAVVINEAAARLIGLKDPLNQKIYEWQDQGGKSGNGYTIIGVVKDFNFNSLREQVTPLALFLQEDKGSMAFRMRSNDIPALVAQVEEKWRTMVPNQPFNYSFMDDDFNRLYQSESRMGKISLSFAILAIFIASLGLFGLAAYAAEQRTREIGIRKVLGATMTNIVHLLSKDFLKLVMIAILFAFPLGWWAMHRWLLDFAYRISIGWEIFAAAGFMAIGIALATISFQAIRAALANPVNSLRAQ
ncbi:putative ABC transport system permease protein [Chitinophaga eiseniae]|uniref:Putative ABC transport system permease protein n=1 Tax=Chitinophaga eiseniae TaxID=634771 RepID=A0A1T4P1L8_9BACT|nr:ABC transporter permease [Chitinophaga eiseniae]SJZ85425.1 putative ABC transport system permease protein [Chitinophaga eiseniae]